MTYARPCDRCHRRNKRHGTTHAKHGVAYAVRNKYGEPPLLRIEGSFYPELDACRAYAAARSTFDQDVPLSVVLIWCDGTERTDRSYDDGKVVTV